MLYSFKDCIEVFSNACENPLGDAHNYVSINQGIHVLSQSSSKSKKAGFAHKAYFINIEKGKVVSIAIYLLATLLRFDFCLRNYLTILDK